MVHGEVNAHIYSYGGRGTLLKTFIVFSPSNDKRLNFTVFSAPEPRASYYWFYQHIQGMMSGSIQGTTFSATMDFLRILKISLDFLRFSNI